MRSVLCRKCRMPMEAGVAACPYCRASVRARRSWPIGRTLTGVGIVCVVGTLLVLGMSQNWLIGVMGGKPQEEPIEHSLPATAPPRRSSADGQSNIIAKLKELGSQVNTRNGQVFGFGGPQVTDEALTHLQDLKTVTLLQLANSKVTDAGLAHLAGLTGLQQLYLTKTPITDAGLQHLKEMKGLRTLALDYTKISDAGLEELRGLTQLQWLNLQFTAITDAGLVHLESMENLRGLSVAAGNEVTPEGVNKLKQALPNCEIQN